MKLYTLQWKRNAQWRAADKPKDHFENYQGGDTITVSEKVYEAEKALGEKEIQDKDGNVLSVNPVSALINHAEVISVKEPKKKEVKDAEEEEKEEVGG